jgi:2-polyprenyl-6-methoxyphenol hydroxylase-like FAD-dependent oxidoreductase
MQTINTRCAIVGGGPAGMMLGFLLGRAGIDVVVTEKHADFNRDFRGDTIHPSTLELMYELGLLEEFLKVPHQELRQLRAVVNGNAVPIADFSHLPTHCKFIAFMPQWDFLNFLTMQARQFSNFHLLMETEVTDLVAENGRVTAARARTSNGELELRADLVIGSDGRHSRVRAAAGLEVIELGVPIDVLWMRLPKHDDDPEQSLGFFRGGKLLVLLDRGDYWQCGYVIPKGGLDQLKATGLENFQTELVQMSSFLEGRVRGLDDWSKVKLLTVQINRLRNWCRDGLLCIGDAAHAMSPAGGVGINLAIQDAVASANLLGEPLRRGNVTLDELRSVQKRREWPARLIQTIQMFIHRRINGKGDVTSTDLPLIAKMFRAFPVLRRIPARMIGMGPRPEHMVTSASSRCS